MSDVTLMDVGNSSLKWAVADTLVLGAAHALAVDDPAALGTNLRPVLAATATGPRRIVACCVAADDVRAAVERAAVSMSTEVHWLHAQAQFDDGAVALRNGYRDPQQLGADRWHALLGARMLYPDKALVLVQAGTATTVDGVTADGQFVGGSILPGVTLMRQSLVRGTARLQVDEQQALVYPRPFPVSTAEAIACGVLDAQIGAVQRFMQRFMQPLGGSSRCDDGDAQLVLTGGAGHVLAAALEASEADHQCGPHHLVPDLVLRGLWLRWKHSLET